MTIDLSHVKEEVMNFMDKGKYIKPAKLLFNTFRSLGPGDITSFGDLMNELAQKYPDLFIEKIYIAFQFQLRKNLPQDILYELDKYILEKYCLLEGETITDFFNGSLRDKFNATSGRIFITNFRVIVSGYPISVDKSSSPVITSFTGLRKELIHIAIGRSLRKALNRDIKDLEIMPYGFYYPIHNAYKIKREKSAVSYNIDIGYERKSKSKVENLKIRISPGKMKDNPERKEEILNKLETLLIENQ